MRKATTLCLSPLRYCKPRFRRCSPAAHAFSGYEPGTIVVKTSERQLYYVLENGESLVSSTSRSAGSARPGPA